MESKRNRCILLIKMFNGNYLDEFNNIGHEVINLFRADNGKHYIYALPGGLVGENKNGKVTDILLVQNVGNNNLKVLGRIKDITPKQHIAQYKGKDKKEDVKELVRNYKEVKFGNTSIDDIFKDNTYKNDKDISSVNYTFEVESNQYRKPKKNFIIRKGNNKSPFELSNTKFHQTRYYVETKDPKEYNDYEKICNIIDTDSYWEGDDSSPFVKKGKDVTNTNRTFLTICNKEYDEIIYSNLLAYYLSKYPNILDSFIKEVLGLSMSGPFTIKREHKHIDILITNSDSAIIIENKIKSGINGIKDDGKCQLDKYVKELSEGNAKEKECKKYGINHIFGYVFCPSYNQISIDCYKSSYMERYYTNGKENIITYEILHKFFERLSKTIEQDPYYGDFVTALSLHSKNYDAILENVMLERFMFKVYNRI